MQYQLFSKLKMIKHTYILKKKYILHIKLTTINKADFIPWTAEASIFGALRLGGKVLRDGNKETLIIHLN